MDRFQTHKDAEKKDNTMIAEQYRKMLDAKSVIRQLSPPRYTILAISPKTDCVRTILSLFCSSIKYTRAFVLRKLPFSVRSGALSLPLRRAQAAEKKRSPVFG